MSKRFLTGVNITGGTTLIGVVDAGVDTDKFIVLDSNGVIKYRTGSEILTDISAVSDSRILTINGTAYDLTQNRIWTINNASLGAQPQLNGTGFVKISGTTISYDSSTYQTILTNPVTGTGTNNFIAKFTSTGSTIGNSLVYDNGTSVGINTTTPSLQGFNNELTISSGTSGTRRTALNIQGSRTTASTFASIGFYHQANFVASIESSRGGADNSGNLQFFTTNAGVTGERMTIDPSGNVGIGTSSPLSILILLINDVSMVSIKTELFISGVIQVSVGV